MHHRLLVRHQVPRILQRLHDALRIIPTSHRLEESQTLATIRPQRLLSSSRIVHIEIRQVQIRGSSLLGHIRHEGIDDGLRQLRVLDVNVVDVHVDPYIGLASAKEQHG